MVSACDAKCKTCAGKADFCLTCAPGLAFNGTCVSACPSNTYEANGTCTVCHPDCSTCSGPGAAACLTCPSSRPLLQNGRCLSFCPKGSYAAGAKCENCNASCSSCTSGSSCTGCRDGYVLRAGVCVAVTCPFATSFGMCLSGFINDTPENKPASRSLAPLAALAIVPVLLVLALVWHIRRQRREIRERTAEFAAQLDEQAVGKRLAALAVQEEQEDTKRRGLKDLWLKNKARAARPTSQESVDLERNVPMPKTKKQPEAVQLRDFMPTGTSDDIGQDPGPTAPPANKPGGGPTDAAMRPVPKNGTGAPSADINLTQLWPNLPSQPNAPQLDR